MFYYIQVFWHVETIYHIILCYVIFFSTKTNDIYIYYTMYINSIYVHIWYIVYICLSYFPKRCAVQIWTTRQQQKALSWLFASLPGTKTSTIYLYFVYQILFSLLICKYIYTSCITYWILNIIYIISRWKINHTTKNHGISTYMTCYEYCIAF
jgi:hypothetical protein